MKKSQRAWAVEDKSDGYIFPSSASSERREAKRKFLASGGFLKMPRRFRTVRILIVVEERSS